MPLLVNAYSTIVNPCPIDFPCTLINQRGLDDPQLMEHLNGFLGYVMQAGDGQMNARRYALYRHIQRVKHQFSFEIAEASLATLAEWGQQANVILYLPDGTICNASGAVLLYPDGRVDWEAEMPYTADALVRKANTEQYLANLGLSVPASLPPVVGESEVFLRSADEVAKRALAVMLTAIQGESFRDGEAFSPTEFAERCPIGFAALSPLEQAFVHGQQPSERDIVNMTWRYEALLPLQWAINWQEELPFPDTICDVGMLVDKGLEYCKQPMGILTLKPVNELLDELDLHYRLHWLAREYRIKEQEMPEDLLEGVIQERHYALNWLTGFENADWDKVDTPT